MDSWAGQSKICELGSCIVANLAPAIYTSGHCGNLLRLHSVITLQWTMHTTSWQEKTDGKKLTGNKLWQIPVWKSCNWKAGAKKLHRRKKSTSGFAEACKTQSASFNTSYWVSGYQIYWWLQTQIDASTRQTHTLHMIAAYGHTCMVDRLYAGAGLGVRNEQQAFLLGIHQNAQQ